MREGITSFTLKPGSDDLRSVITKLFNFPLKKKKSGFINICEEKSEYKVIANLSESPIFFACQHSFLKER